MKKAIEVKNVSKTFDDGRKEITALKDTNFSVEEENLLRLSDQVVQVRVHF